MPGQIWARPPRFCQGRQALDRAEIFPTPWIWAFGRPPRFCVGRESTGKARVGQIFARAGIFPTPTILPGSGKIWPRPDLARPLGLGFAPERLGFASEDLAFATEYLAFATEYLAFASEDLAFATEYRAFALNIHQDVKGYPPKWFLAITCTSWLRLNFWRRGFARNFGAHLFGFYAPGLILEPLVQFLALQISSGQHFGPGTFWGQIWGPQKHTFIMKLISHGVSGDFP